MVSSALLMRQERDNADGCSWWCLTLVRLQDQEIFRCLFFFFFTPGECLEELTPAWNGSLSDLKLMRRKRRENCTWLLHAVTIMRTDKHMQVSGLGLVPPTVEVYVCYIWINQRQINNPMSEVFNRTYIFFLLFIHLLATFITLMSVRCGGGVLTLKPN